MKNTNRLIIIGWDGACWEALDNLMSHGYLPNLKRWLGAGANRTTLESTLPSLTIPAWSTFATGLNPGRYGTYGFLKPGTRFGEADTISGDDIKAVTFYEVLEQNGYECCLVNLPASYPARLRNGITVTSFLSPGDHYYFPKKTRVKSKIQRKGNNLQNLAEIIPELKKYQVQPSLIASRFSSFSKYLKELRKVEKRRFTVVKRLYSLKHWDLFFVLFSGSDGLSHRAFDSLTTNPPNPQTAALFADFDDYLGWFIKQEGQVLLMSDHGFATYRGQFYLNRWLQQKGYLHLTSGSSKTNVLEHSLAGAVRGRNLIRGALNILHNQITQQLVGITARHLSQLEWSPRSDLLLHLAGWGLHADPQTSAAYGWPATCGLIYLNHKSASLADGLKKKIQKELEELKDTAGRKVLSQVLTKEEVYHGPYLDSAPDLIIVPGEYYINPTLSPGPALEEEPTFGHSKKGIAVVGDQLPITGNPLHLADLAPAILGHFGISASIPAPAPKPDSPTKSTTPNQKIIERLRGLGYLD